MGFQFDSSGIQISNPVAAGTPFRFSYQVTNTGPDDGGHQDHVEIWGNDGSKPVDSMENAPPSVAGGLYGVFVSVPALNAGYYDVKITLADGTAAGTTAIVQ